jgi:hypothetical protein
VYSAPPSAHICLHLLEYNLKTSKTLNATQLANKIGNITAMVQIGSVGGALIAFIACDKIGVSSMVENYFE